MLNINWSAALKTYKIQIDQKYCYNLPRVPQEPLLEPWKCTQALVHQREPKPSDNIVAMSLKGQVKNVIIFIWVRALISLS